jgi:hypothetical protein
MDFEFTDEQKLFAESVRRFALAHLERDTLRRVPFGAIRTFAEYGTQNRRRAGFRICSPSGRS